MNEPRGLVNEARKIVGGIQDWARAAAGHHHEQPTVNTCEWCPLCQFADVIATDNPVVADKIAEAGAAVVVAIRAIIEAAAQDTYIRVESSEAPDAAERPRPRPSTDE